VDPVATPAAEHDEADISVAMEFSEPTTTALAIAIDKVEHPTSFDSSTAAIEILFSNLTLAEALPPSLPHELPALMDWEFTTTALLSVDSESPTTNLNTSELDMSVDYGSLEDFEQTSVGVLSDQLAQPISMPLDMIASHFEFLEQFTGATKPQETLVDTLATNFDVLNFTTGQLLDPVAESMISSMDWLATLDINVPIEPACLSLLLR
jgi:hypothetical protein